MKFHFLSFIIRVSSGESVNPDRVCAFLFGAVLVELCETLELPGEPSIGYGSFPKDSKVFRGAFFMNKNRREKMNEANQTFLEKDGIITLMRKYAIPCIISLLVGALYNIVDQIFIANASYLGSYGNAANTVVFPLTVIALAIAVCIGDGSCAFTSLLLGRNEKDKASKSMGNAVVLAVVTGVVLCIIYLCFQNQIISMFGGTVNEETFRCSKEYFLWISYGIPFYMFGQAMNPVIRSDGSPKFAMISTLAGAVINIILDPIFIFGCIWGMMGAALAIQYKFQNA